jgi:hypothetical protein
VDPGDTSQNPPGIPFQFGGVFSFGLTFWTDGAILITLTTQERTMQTNCQALAKVTINKKLQTFRIVFTFDKYNKITVRNAALVTGDLCSVDYEFADVVIAKAVQNAQSVLRTNNIQIVD